MGGGGPGAALSGCGGRRDGPVAGRRQAAADCAPLPPATVPAMGDDDKIIRFPGGGTAAPRAKAGKAPPPPALGPDGLTEEQRKAVQLVLSGMSFVLVALKPSERGADFYTALHGDPTDLRNAQPHLAGVIERLYARKGL